MSKEYYKGWKLALLNIGIGLGTFIQILDSSIANVAVPYIAGNLSVSPDEGTWVITSFAASNAIVLPLTGWLSNYFGSVRLFVWSVLLFSLVSFLCGLSTTLTMLVVLRVIQGAVAGCLIPLSQNLIVQHNPKDKQGGALGFWATVVVAAPILGPIIGGYLTYVYSWPWIFYINVPIGILAAFIVWFFLQDRESPIVRDPIDWVGLFLLALSVGSLQIMLDKGQDLDWFDSKVIIGLTLVSVISFSYFIIWNYYQKYPIVDFSFFKNRNFTIGTIAITLGFLVYFGSTVTVPLWLQTQMGYTALLAGIAIAPVGIAPFLFSTTIGNNLYRFDIRWVITLCFVILSASFFYQANFTTAIDLKTIMLARLFQGFGIALFFLPILQLSFADLPKEKYASASGLYHFIRILIGSGFGTSLSIYLWWRRARFSYSRLSEQINDGREVINQFYRQMQALGPQFDKDVINGIVDMQVEREAYMLSTNDLSWLSAFALLCIIPFLYFTKKGEAKKVELPHE